MAVGRYSPSMDAVDLDRARTALEAERDRLLVELGDPIQAPGQMTYGSQAAAASQVFAQQRDLALRDKAAQQLGLVEAALARVADGSYGRCLRCGQPIAPGRLDALPWVAHCIDCQTAIDKARR